MRDGPFKTCTAAVLTAAIVLSAYVPSVPLLADKEPVSFENEEEMEEETEDADEEEIGTSEQETEADDCKSGDGGMEEETAADIGSEDETQGESDANESSDDETEGSENEPEASPEAGETETESSEESESETNTESEQEDESETEQVKSDRDNEDAASSDTEGSGNLPKGVSDPENIETEPYGFDQSNKKGTDNVNSKPESEQTVNIEGRTDIEIKKGTSWNSENTVYSGTYWDSNWYVQSDFRFTQVDKVPVISEGNVNGVTVYSATEDNPKIVGILPYFSVAYVLEDDLDDNWLYVESGDLRGFVKKDDLADPEYSEALVESIGEENFSSGVMTCEKADNEAFLYTKTTVYDVIAEKEYAVSAVKGDIYEYPSETSRAVGEAGSGTLAYILEETDGGWLFVESGEVRGFVPASSLISGTVAEDIVDEVGETEIVKATVLVEPEGNRNLYYTLKSVETAATSMGEAIAEYALSLVGLTKYVWGGTDLMLGADCSGFIQSIYASFGVSIPRLAQDQGACGQLITSLSDAKPGDIIYYASGPHVGIYVGNGQVVQCSGSSSNTASNPGRGATLCNADYKPITSIRRYIIPTSERTSSGTADSTSYSQSDLELIWAIVAQEDNGSYEGALAVISSAMNRVDSPQWSSLGSNALEQLTAPGQYCYSNDLNWISRLNGNVPDYVKQAVSDCLDKGIRNHSYTSFRSYYANGSEQIGGGNYYFS